MSNGTLIKWQNNEIGHRILMWRDHNDQVDRDTDVDGDKSRETILTLWAHM